jgi:hypothetical protein
MVVVTVQIYTHAKIHRTVYIHTQIHKSKFHFYIKAYICIYIYAVLHINTVHFNSLLRNKCYENTKHIQSIEFNEF